ncbi:unnamed protein product, partial [Ixodes hexagonus]
FYWKNSTELVTRSVLRLSTSLGGRGMPCVDTMCKLFALRSMLSVLDDTGHPARSLALYFLGPSRRTLVPPALGNLYPSAESTPPFYQVTFHEELRQLLPGIVVRDEPPSGVVEEVCSARVTPEDRDRVNAFPWALLVSRRLPSQAEDLEWRRGWEVLPTRQRLHRWGMVPDPRCPNCGQVESNAHVFVNCSVARSFWRLVHHGFQNLGIANCVSGGRCPRGGLRPTPFSSWPPCPLAEPLCCGWPAATHPSNVALAVSLARYALPSPRLRAILVRRRGVSEAMVLPLRSACQWLRPSISRSP